MYVYMTCFLFDPMCFVLFMNGRRTVNSMSLYAIATIILIAFALYLSAIRCTYRSVHGILISLASVDEVYFVYICIYIYVCTCMCHGFVERALTLELGK